MENISHFTHPDHVLSLVQDQSTEYTCDLCKNPGNNLRYKCTTCPDFNLDPFCAISKEDTTSFMHPGHILVLFLSPEVTTTFCSVCNKDIKGGHYSCCDFHVHPVCNKFPEIIKAGTSNKAHPAHELKGIFSSNLTTCHVCRKDCKGLRYRCEKGCDVDFHPWCLAGFGERDMTNDEDLDGNTRGLFSGRFFQGFQGVMFGLNILDLVTTLLGVL